MTIKPDDPAFPTEVVTKWLKNPMDPEDKPKALLKEYRYGFTKKERAVIDNFIRNYAGKHNPADQAKLCVYEIEQLFQVMNDLEGQVDKPRVNLGELIKLELERINAKPE